MAVDTGSPVTSVAIGRGSAVLAQRTSRGRNASSALLRLVDETLREAGLAAAELAGIVALRGPGSFTGLRVGLATILGLHQALGLPATAVPTLDVLLTAMRGEAPTRVAVVDALRGEWFAQVSGRSAPPSGALLRAADIAGLAPCRVIGFGLDALRAELAEIPGIGLEEPPPLAATALGMASALTWDASLLSSPLYLRPAAAQRPA